MPCYISEIDMSKVENVIDKVKSFVKNNPYPNYEEVMELLLTHARETKSAYARRETLNMISEYGKHNHEWMKEIYENIMDEKLIKENGKKINERGDKVAMVYNYDVLCYVLCCKTDKLKCNAVVDIYYPIKTQISECWNGTGDWRH